MVRTPGGGWGSEPPTAGAAAVDRESDPEQVARTIALRLLTDAPRSRAQLATAMARKGVPEPVAESVLDRFAQVGLVDDAAYAQLLVRSQHERSGQTGPALRTQLRRRGIDEELAAQAMATLHPQDEERTARGLVTRKLAATRGLPAEVRLRRTLALLARKGYSSSLSSRLVREQLAVEGFDVTPTDD